MVIEGDNLIVINSKRKEPLAIGHLIKDFILLHHVDKWEIHQAANWIAFIGHLVESTMIIINKRYSHLSEILYHDLC